MKLELLLISLSSMYHLCTSYDVVAAVDASHPSSLPFCCSLYDGVALLLPIGRLIRHVNNFSWQEGISCRASRDEDVVGVCDTRAVWQS